jgi:tetratricopeptide (TPR) repeat protein
MWLWIRALSGCCAFASSESSPELKEFLRVVQVGQELQASGLRDEARRKFTEALDLGQRIDSNREAIALALLASASMDMGRVREAEQALVRCVALHEGLRGQSDYDYRAHATVLTALATIDVQLGRANQAERRFAEALPIWESVTGRLNDPEFAAYLNNLAVLRYQQRQYQKAEESLQQALVIWRQTTTENDPKLVQGMAHLARVRSVLGKDDEADALSAEALRSFAGDQGRNPLIAFQVLCIRSRVLRKAKRVREAKALEAQAQNLVRQTNDRNIVDLATLMRERLR